MTTSSPIAGTSYDQVAREALTAALTGDYRARQVFIGPRRGIITPHNDAAGQLDRNDLAAQIYAICHDLASTTGCYTGGAFTSGGSGYFIPAPDMS